MRSMYKVLLVDDEDIEREAMAAIIPWDKVDMELVDMAWNGIEGLEKVRQHAPDIVITDIKMPVMDGIELIRRAQGLCPDMAFVVLSGYGDYEYTSKAMALGIRHYILKPCDEDKIVEVLLNVKNDLAARKEKQKNEQEMRSSLQRMLPHLKEQILYELLTKKELSLSDQVLLNDFTKNLVDDFILLSVRSPVEFDQLDRFTLTNILAELMGKEQIYASTTFRNEVVYLIPAAVAVDIATLIRETHRVYFAYKDVELRSAVSRNGTISESYQLYCQIQELFYFNENEKNREFFMYEMYRDESETLSMIVNYAGIRQSKRYEELLFEVYSSYAKMELQKIPMSGMWEIFNFALKILFGEEMADLKPCEGVWELLESMVEQCAGQMNLQMPETKDGERLKIIFYAIYRNIRNSDLSLQYLASEVLFMNEDYFGRFFARYMNEKYSAFLIRIRIMLAKRLLVCFPDMKLSDLAEQTGYPADGQYFSKVFKKQTGILLSDYRKAVKNQEL